MKQKLKNVPLWFKRATPQASFWVYLHLKCPSINFVIKLYCLFDPPLPQVTAFLNLCIINVSLIFDPFSMNENVFYGQPFKWNYSELRGVFSHLFWMRGRGYQFFCTQTRISGEWTVQPFCNLPLGGLFQVFLTWSIQEWSCTHYAIFLMLVWFLPV